MKKTLLILVLMALVCAVLTGCSNSGTSVIPEDSAYIGTWEAVKADFKGEDVSLEEAVGDMFIFTLKADGTAEVTSDGEVQQATWKITDNGVSINVDHAKSDTKYTAKDDKLVLSIFGMNIYFAKK